MIDELSSGTIIYRRYASPSLWRLLIDLYNQGDERLRPELSEGGRIISFTILAEIQ